jgi:signal peptidase complex subunit 1
MDFYGQRVAEYLYQALIIVAGVVGFAYGYWQQRFLYTFYFIFAAFVVSMLLVVPDWPFWNRHPAPWQPVSAPKAMRTKGASTSDEDGESDETEAQALLAD